MSWRPSTGSMPGAQGGELLHLLCACQQLQAVQEVVALLRAVGDGAASPAAQHLLLARCLAGPLARTFPCSRDYQRRLLKAVVLAAEADGAEVEEELMGLYTECLVSPHGSAAMPPAGAGLCLPVLPAPPAGWSYKLFAYAPRGQPPAATLAQLAQIEARFGAAAAAEWQQAGGAGDSKQLGAAAAEGKEEGSGCSSSGELPGRLPPLASEGGSSRCGLMALRVSNNLFEGGTGCHEWEAGFYLAEVVLSNPGLFAGRSCLELGAGCGMVGVALHRAGAAAAICTDGDTQSVFNCRWNLQLNGVPLRGLGVAQAACGRLKFQPTAGGRAEAAVGTGMGADAYAECRELRWEEGAGGLAPDLVLGADILYDPLVIPILLDLVKELLRNAAGSQQALQVTERRSGEGTSAVAARPPAALIATTLRNAATLAQFVATVGADPELTLQDVSQAAAEGQLAEIEGMAAAAGQPVRYLHNPALEGARDRIVLHRLTLT